MRIMNLLKRMHMKLHNNFKCTWNWLRFETNRNTFHICGYVCLACPIIRCLYCFFLTNANAFVWNCIIASLSSLKHEFIDTQITASLRLIFPMRRHLYHCTAPLRNVKCELMCNSIQDNICANNAFASLHLLITSLKWHCICNWHCAACYRLINAKISNESSVSSIHLCILFSTICTWQLACTFQV